MEQRAVFIGIYTVHLHAAAEIIRYRLSYRKELAADFTAPGTEEDQHRQFTAKGQLIKLAVRNMRHRLAGNFSTHSRFSRPLPL
ncbi:hypothetical protein D3C75_1217970 [compost metagenome]